ncbi:MAG: ferredoxin family protein [Prevotellaceae bacterium]|jgi:NAD-dependent dihydropyrimidine dehydrogenase PreA subunit|nr:ferredoxin family protein [Prevotellaceae bacterium]
MSLKKVTICLCASRPHIDRQAVIEIANALKTAGYEIQIEPDLCATAIDSQQEMEAISTSTVIACYPRAINALFERFGLKASQTLNLRTSCSSEILKHFNIESASASQVLETGENQVKSAIDAWYPVLDSERCIQCGKCHDFCLFGVYTLDNGEVRVTNPTNCKTDCPACARTCPVKAVIFPKYPKSPINGGLDDEESASSNINPNATYGDLLRNRLKERRLTGLSLLKPTKE